MTNAALLRWNFAGGGRMAGAIIQGLVDRGLEPSSLGVADPSPEARESMSRWIPRDRVFTAVSSMVESLADAGLVLAVKPQQAGEVFAALSGRAFPAVVSIAAGIPIARLEREFAPGTPIVRAMPNTPALVGKGMTVIAAGGGVSDDVLVSVQSLLGAVGEVIVLPEEQLDAVTAISGSGPAYFFLFMQALSKAGTALGLAPDTARRLVLSTAEGAAALAHAQQGRFSEMIAAVASKGGTTERALAVFHESDLSGLVAAAARAAYDRSRELSA